jgi:hypothetical protein
VYTFKRGHTSMGAFFLHCAKVSQLESFPGYTHLSA